VELVTETTVVLAAKAPVPDATITVMPGKRPVVLVTVIVVVLPAPAAKDTDDKSGGATITTLSPLKKRLGCPVTTVGILINFAIVLF
jgi:hypothetical protein